MGQEEEQQQSTVAMEEEDSSESQSDSSERHELSGPWSQRKQTQLLEISSKLINGCDLASKIEAAKEIRNLVRKSSASSAKTRLKLGASGVITPLVTMLVSSDADARQASLLALLNLAVRNDRNKVKIVTAGAVPPLVEILKYQDGSLRDLATAAILTLSAAALNKPIIVASGAVPLLVQILSTGSVQGKVDAVIALHNLSTCKDNATAILDATAVRPLINLLKECKKYSKFAEKTTALLEILCNSDEGRLAVSDLEGGILTLVETVEDGSLISTEHAVGALLTLCHSCRDKYRELILKEGAVPGLLRLTVDGTPEAREKARILLDLLRDSPQEKHLTSSVLERIVFDIATRVDGADKAAETAKRLLEDMVKRSMEHSMSRIQKRAATYTPNIQST